MVVPLLTNKYGTEMYGVLHCYDRVVISGNLHPFCYAKGMTGYLYAHAIRIFDYVKFATPLRQAIREKAAALAKGNGLEIEFIRQSKAFRKEKRIKQILAERGTHPGLVHIFSAMEHLS